MRVCWGVDCGLGEPKEYAPTLKCRWYVWLRGRVCLFYVVCASLGMLMLLCACCGHSLVRNPYLLRSQPKWPPACPTTLLLL